MNTSTTTSARAGLNDTCSSHNTGYNWNEGGRLDELKIRNLARKFLNIWMQNTFGRILPQSAESHYHRVILQRAFEGWREEWWTTGREWGLTIRANCHYRYYLCQKVFLRWKKFMSSQQEKRKKLLMAQAYADKHSMCRAWEKWKVFTKKRQMKNKMLESALELNRLATMKTLWSLWKLKLQQRQHMGALQDRRLVHRETRPQGTESDAAVWITERELPQYFSAWIENTQQRRLKKEMKRGAETFTQHRQYSWVLNTWRAKTQTHKEMMSSEETATVNDEHQHMQGASIDWRQLMRQQNEDVERKKTADCVYLHNQGNCSNSEICERVTEPQASCHSQLNSMKWAFGLWKRFVQRRKLKKTRLAKMQLYYQTKFKKETFIAWKNRHFQMSEIHREAEKLYTLRTHTVLRHVLSEWRVNAGLLSQAPSLEQQAQNYFQRHLQSKMFVAWRAATANSVLRCHQLGETLSRVQCSLNQVLLLHSFTKWRRETSRAVQTRKSMENAKQHHQFKLVSKAMNGWKEHCSQRVRYKVMKRQGILLLRLKTYQVYFEWWKMKLQHRRRESVQTEQALWHWSVSLQAKVLTGWRRWAVDQQRQREQTSRAALVYRDQLLQEGVTHILTYAAHMNDLTVNLIEQSKQPHDAHRRKEIQRAVKRCAMKWKERALCKPHTVHAIESPRSKKNVTFSLPDEEIHSEPNNEEESLCEMLHTSILRRQPRRCAELFECPQKSLQVDIQNTPHPLGNSSTLMRHPTVSLSSDVTKLSSTHRSDVLATLSPSKPYMFTLDYQTTPNKDLLLPPSAFMTSETLERLGTSHYVHQRTPMVETNAETDVMSTLTEELMVILQEMKSFHQAKQQLRTWQQLTDILQSWLQTSGKEEEVEKRNVCRELNELRECIKQLSADLAGRKPKMILHADRIGHLRTALQNKGFAFSHR